MTRALFGILAIIAGLALIRHFWPKPRYITLSGAVNDGQAIDWILEEYRR